MSTPLSVSEVSICNLALTRIGEQPITSLDESSLRARLCARFFPLVRDAELRDHNWNACIKRVKLTQDVTAQPGFAFAYALPADYVFLLEIIGAPEQAPYKIENGYLLTDLTEASIRYVFKSTNTQGWDALFVDVLAWRLAKDLAIPITGSASVRNAMDAEYARAIPKARTRDGQEDFPSVIPANDLIWVRY